MKQIFADTNGWIALNSIRDRLHEKTVEANRELLRSGHRYITTNFVSDGTNYSCYRRT